MARNLTKEQIDQFREDERDKLRARKLGFVFSNIHTSNEHEDWDKMSKEQKEAAIKAAQGSQLYQVSSHRCCSTLVPWPPALKSGWRGTRP